MIVTEKKHEKKFNDARIALSLDLLRDYYGPSIPLNPISSLWNARKSSHSRFIGKRISS